MNSKSDKKEIQKAVFGGAAKNAAERPEYRRDALPIVVCADHPGWVDLYNDAWRMAFRNLDDPGKKGWKTQMTCMPGVGILWQWDSCFMTLFGRYSNGTMPCMNNLDNLYRLQRSDGYISMAYRIVADKPAYGERINPPLFAWAEWEHHVLTGDDSRLSKVFHPLARYYGWIEKNRRRSNGLYWFEDSGSSGMDNAPRSGYLSEAQNGSDVSFVDLISQQALSALCLSRIARHLGKKGEAHRFHDEHRRLKGLANKHHWCASKGIYLDVFGRHPDFGPCVFLNHKTAASFWPLVSGVAEETHAKCLVEHLLNPAEFWTPHPVPSLSRDDPNYDPMGGYWLGSVWAPMNYMVVRGLAAHGRSDVAREIAVRHLDAMCAVRKSETYHDIWECYSPEFMRPATKYRGELVRGNLVGWSGLGPIAMLIENILGFHFDAPANHVTWTVATPGEHGIRNMRFNGNMVSMICEGARRPDGARRVVVHAAKPFKLTLSQMGRRGATRSMRLRRGENVMSLDFSPTSNFCG